MKQKLLSLISSILLLCMVSDISHSPIFIPVPDVYIEYLTQLTIEPTVTVKIPLTRITSYNYVEEQTDSTPDISACGKNIPNQIALSRDLFTKDLCGTEVTIILDNGTEYDAIIWDTMHPRWIQTADIPSETYKEARQFGVKQGVLIFD